MEAFEPDGRRMWRIIAQEAVGDMGPGVGTAELRGVRAVIYEDGKPALELTAKKGTADEESGLIILRDAVQANTSDKGSTVTCDRITWERDQRSLVADGKVVGRFVGFEVGPVERAVARFKPKTGQVNTSATAALILASLTLQGKVVTYRDKAGNMDVQSRTFAITFDEQRNVYTFRGTGPFIANWTKQKLRVTGNKLEGTIASTGTGQEQAFELRDGVFSGDITARLDDTGNRGRMTLSGLDIFKVKATDDGKSWDISGQGNFTATLPDSGATIKGNAFTALADRNRTDGNEVPEWRSARFSGGVSGTVSQTDKKTGKPFVINISCPTVTMDRAAATMILSGGVKIDGDHPVLGPVGAEITAPKVTLEFDKEMRVLKNVSMEGG